MGGKGDQENPDNCSNLSQSPKFFKIIVNPEDDKLRIPTGFIRKYGRDLPDKVTLKAPNGSVRQVELVQLDGETWFYNGWDKFKDYYAIRIGHMLVFDYDGKSRFDVIIFDMTAMEIEYPPANDASEDEGDRVRAETKVNASQSEDSVVILKQIHMSPKGKRKRNDSQDKCRGFEGSLSKKTMTTIMDKEKCVAYQKAKAFKSNNPFCICLMQPSYVTPPTILCVPLRFVKENLPKPENNVMLRIKAKGTWSAKCSLVNPYKATMTGGWRKFVKDNGLKVGDACVFEVNKRENLLWNVTIFRVPKTVVNEPKPEDSAIILKHVCTGLQGKGKRNCDKERIQMGRIIDKETWKTYRKAKQLVFKNPICIRIMQPAYVTGRFSLNISLSFAKEHLPAKRNKLKLQVQNMTWTVTCVTWTCNATICSGWRKFVKDNALKVGDTCVFEVNRRKKCLWNVTIVRC